MAFKSEAQRKKLAQLVKEGKLSQKVFDEFAKESEGLKLPDRASPKKLIVRRAKVIK